MKNKKVFFTVRIPAALSDRLKRESEETGMSQTMIAEDAFIFLLASPQWKEMAKQRRELRGIAPTAQTDIIRVKSYATRPYDLPEDRKCMLGNEVSLPLKRGRPRAGQNFARTYRRHCQNGRRKTRR